jgi:hypothetical protein
MASQVKLYCQQWFLQVGNENTPRRGLITCFSGSNLTEFNDFQGFKTIKKSKTHRFNPIAHSFYN